jgi:hypothetical protein
MELQTRLQEISTQAADLRSSPAHVTAQAQRQRVGSHP